MKLAPILAIAMLAFPASASACQESALGQIHVNKRGAKVFVATNTNTLAMRFRVWKNGKLIINSHDKEWYDGGTLGTITEKFSARNGQAITVTVRIVDGNGCSMSRSISYEAGPR